MMLIWLHFYCNYITIDTYWDYPAYMQELVNPIEPRPTCVVKDSPKRLEEHGVAATMTPSQYLTAESTLITVQPSLSQSRHILDMNPDGDSPYG